MHTRFVTLIALIAFVTPLRAQHSTSAPRPAAVFERFLRIASTVSQPVDTLVRIWPNVSGAGPSSSTLDLTAAHAVSVTTDTDPAKRDAVVRVMRVRWSERVADTVALRQRISASLQEIAKAAGPAERCIGPAGPPAYLFSPQTAVRYWSRGLSGQPTQLTWTVAPGSVYTIEVDVGLFSDQSSRAPLCTAQLP